MTSHRAHIRRIAVLGITSIGLAGLGVGAAAPGYAETTDGPSAAATAPIPGYQLAWADEFGGVNGDGTGLDEDEWFYREGDKAICTNRPENVTVGDGLLHIAFDELDVPIDDDITTSCGGVVSKQWFGYGYYETRAKLWGDQGFHSAFWTTGLSAYIPDVPGYTGPHNRINEIDGFEVDSHAPDKLAYHSHWFMPGHVGNQGKLITQQDTSAAYHAYGFEWTPTEVKFYTDGVLQYTLPKAGPHGIQNIWLTTLGYTDGVIADDLPGETTWDYFRYFAPVATGHDQSAASVVVDNGDPGYSESGVWHYEVTNGRQVAFGFQDKTVRASDTAGSTASWTPSLSAGGSYEVYAWNPSLLATGQTAAHYAVIHDGGTTDVVVDQTKAGQQWVSLGSYSFTPGSGQKVTASSDPAGTGTLRADAVKFVPSTVIDNGTPGYTETGAWNTSTGVTGWRGTDTRYSANSTAKAHWTPTLAAGTYDVYAWLPPRDANTPPTSQFTVAYAGGTASVPISAATTSGGWLRLGNYPFASGTAGHVDYDQVGTTPPKQMRVDAVKFVPAPPETGAPATPGGLGVAVTTTPANGNAYFTADWSPVAGADVVGYHVYLDGQRLTWQPVKRTSFRMHELLAGQNYQITVTAVDRLGNESAPSAGAAAIVPADTQAPTPPSGLLAEAANSKAVLYWSQNTELDLGGYNVYVDGILVNDEPVGNINDETNRPLGYEVPDLANDVAHSIAVTTLDLVGNESAPTTTSVTPLPMAIVGVEDPGYTEAGSVWAASSVAGWLSSKTRASLSPGATAEWRPDLAESGEYDVYAWVPNHSNASPSARFAVTDAAGTTTTDIDQRSGGAAWVLLGRFDFAAGTSGSVSVSNAAGTGYLRTNTVKFVPVS
jgi:beta-glucanase (GH16 family)